MILDLLILLVALRGTPPAAVQSSVARSTPEDVKQLDLDALITRLPPVGCEGRADQNGTFVWDPAVAELRRRLADGLSMTDVQWRNCLMASGVIRHRAKWPAELPFAVFMHDPGWVYPVKITAVPDDPALRTAVAGALIHGDCGWYEFAAVDAQAYQELGRLGLGKHKIVFDVTVERGRTREELRFRDTRDPKDRPERSDPPPGILWHGPISIEVEIVPTLADVIPGRTDPELEQSIRRSLRYFDPYRPQAVAAVPGQFVFPPDHAQIEFSSEGDAFPALSTTAVTIEVELCKDGKPLATGWSAISRLGGFTGCLQPELVWDSGYVPFPQVEKEILPTSLIARVRGIPRDVLRHWNASSWWNGSLTVEVKDLPPSDLR